LSIIKNIPAFQFRPCNLLLKNKTNPLNDKRSFEKGNFRSLRLSVRVQCRLKFQLLEYIENYEN